MARAGRRFALHAVVVESLFGLLLLFLLFPSFSDPTTSASRGLPVLNIASRAGAATERHPSGAELRWEQRAATETQAGDTQRRQFVTRELDYVRRAITAMLAQHVPDFKRPPRDVSGP